MGGAEATLEFGRTLPAKSAGNYLEERFQVPNQRLGLPIGISESDRFFAQLEILSDRPLPQSYAAARGRLIDALVNTMIQVKQESSEVGYSYM